MRVFQLFLTHWRFVLILCEFFVNFIEFLWICWGLMDLSRLFGMFLIRFGFLCIFFGFLAIVEIDFRSRITIFWNFGFSYVFQRFFLGFLGFYKKFVTYSRKLLLFNRLFQFCSAYWRFVLILFEFSMNFKDLSKFWEVLWIFLDLMECSWFGLGFYVSFLVFWVLSRLILDCW